MKFLLHRMLGVAIALLSTTALSKIWEMEIEVRCSGPQAKALVETLVASQQSFGIQVLGSTETPEGTSIQISASDPNGIVDVQLLCSQRMSLKTEPGYLRGYSIANHPIFLDAVEQGSFRLPELARHEQYAAPVDLKRLSGITREELRDTYGLEFSGFNSDIGVLRGTREQIVRVAAEKGFHPYDPRFGGTPPASDCPKLIAPPAIP